MSGKTTQKLGHLQRGQDANVTEVSLGKVKAFCGNVNMGIPAHTLKGPGSVSPRVSEQWQEAQLYQFRLRVPAVGTLLGI